MAWFLCKKCGEKYQNIIREMYRCPNCLKIYCNECLDEPGVGFIRRGFCPHCGAEVHDEDRCQNKD